MRLFHFLFLILFAWNTFATDKIPQDPLGSIQWDDMYRAFLKDHPVVFDQRVIVKAPEFAEDSMNVPVSVDASEIANIKEILVFAEFNPIARILRFYPEKAKAAISFRFKIQQASPIRAAVLTTDNVWHVGGVWIDAAGGGCTTASDERLGGSWEDHLGEIYTGNWKQQSSNRFKMMINHPMDTGLVAGIPSFYIEKVVIVSDSGEPLARIEPYEPVQENPVFTLDLMGKSGAITIEAVDNNANEYFARVVQ